VRPPHFFRRPCHSWPGFTRRTVHVGFMVYKMALGILCESLSFSQSRLFLRCSKFTHVCGGWTVGPLAVAFLHSLILSQKKNSKLHPLPFFCCRPSVCIIIVSSWGTACYRPLTSTEFFDFFSKSPQPNSNRNSVSKQATTVFFHIVYSTVILTVTLTLTQLLFDGARETLPLYSARS
jgi:hypothetical protein